MSGFDYDAVIAGGGLSGLSLAAHLATGGWRDRRVLIVDDRAARPAALSWAFWSDRPGLLDDAVSRSYDRVRVRAAGAEWTIPLGRYRYRVVRRSDLVRVVRWLLRRCRGFEIRSGRVDGVRDGADAAQTTVDGRVVRSRWAFDSVSRPPTSPVDARLAFTGWEVVCDRPHFDPAEPTLFDFRAAPAGGARFVYVRPDGPTRALVEVTEFVPRHSAAPPVADRRADVAAYLRDVVHCDRYRIEQAESAVVPLTCRPGERRGRRVLAIGARAGLVKASTGYAYQRIQRDSAAIAASVVRRGHPFDGSTTAGRHRVLDAVLLEVLDRDPSRLEQVFARLFAANPVERVLSFLDEQTSVGDELRLIASLPPTPFLRASVAALARRPTGRWSRPVRDVGPSGLVTRDPATGRRDATSWD
jgi:lycopene beta-cyclase